MARVALFDADWVVYGRVRPWYGDENARTPEREANEGTLLPSGAVESACGDAPQHAEERPAPNETQPVRHGRSMQCVQIGDKMAASSV